ncbi:FAD-dependent oxidoreductase [Bdellovibrio sp. HCB290]|uniref:FAD-dependent oxidoreductase n=1 Tax=Bdellovibrio sp. HCB290 TaxID=3394356 RepID=UPI0039B64CB9
MKSLAGFAFILILSLSAFGGDKTMRIGIVGGGPGGLSAAHRLQKAGFTNVVVLERAPEVGGKTETIQYQGQNYEMGAIMSGPSYEEVVRLAAEVGEKIVPFSPGADTVVEADPASPKMKAMSWGKKLGYLAAAVEYHLIYRKYSRYLANPGMSAIPAELNEPFSTWIAKNARFHGKLQELLSHSFVSFGYGYMSEIPAAYVLRYFSPRLLRSFMFGQVRMLENGYQNLWKKIAAPLKVKNNFEVNEAKRINNEWHVRSNTGQQEIFDVMIWTAPLEKAAQALPLNPQLKSVFSKIEYQYYNSALVEVEGLPKRGSGVVTKNYDSSQAGNVVSWLHRWPNKSNVANFYTLSNQFMSPEAVESGLKQFADTHGFKINSVVKSVGWKYFPHFSQEALDQHAYQLIEGTQGREGLYFAGELMNFSTVEHSAEYSRDLVDRYFIKTEKLSAVLPSNYDGSTGKEKLQVLWKRIVDSEYDQRPTYADVSSGMWKQMSLFLPAALSKAFNNNTDIIIKGREKVIHKLGSTALIHFEPKDSGYNAFDALIRLSNAVDGSGGLMYPSFSIKIPLDGVGRSINFNVGKSFDSQHIGNNPKGPTDYNFFRDDKVYPFSNELPNIRNTPGGKVFKWIFDQAHLAPNYIPVDEMTKIMNKPAPRRFVFRAPPSIRNLMQSEVYQDEREVFERIPEGTVLFEVYESTGLQDPGRLVGEIKTASRFVSSKFGDQNLFFRHESRDVKKPQAEFSRNSYEEIRGKTGMPLSCAKVF